MKFRNAFQKSIILISCSLVYFIIYGAIRLNSQLFVAVRDRFRVDRERGSLPFTLLYSVRNLCGPFIGFLGKKFGLRCTTVFGCVLSAVSIAACFLIDDIISFTILWGVGFALGFGLSSLLIPNILHLYFTKSFNMVQGIYLAAGSSGSFVLPGVVEYFLREYGTSGTFLIISGIVLNSVPLSILLKCPEETLKDECNVQVKEKVVVSVVSDNIKTLEYAGVPKSNIHSESLEVHALEVSTLPSISNGVIMDISGLTNTKMSSINDTLEKSIPDKDENKLKYANYNCNFEKDLIGQRYLQYGLPDNVASQSKETEQIQNNVQSSEPEVRKNNVFTGNKSKSMEHFDLHPCYKYNVTNPSRDPSIFISRYVQVFYDPAFILILISSGVALIPVTVFTTIMVDASRDKGISEDVTILMVYSTADIVGRLLFGYVSDLSFTSTLNIYALCNALFGVMSFGFTWLSGFYAVVGLYALVGLMTGGIVATAAGVTRDSIEEENLTMALSSRCFLFGILNLSQPSVIGYFRETLKSYNGLFYCFGSLSIFGAIVALCIPKAVTYRDRRK